ncbi:hypothetical protein ACOIVT_004239 [Vibrio parahaemolyticus]
MNEKRLRELASLTTTHSENLVDALVEHICRGMSQQEAAERFGVKESAVSRLASQVYLANKEYLRELVSLTNTRSDAVVEAVIEHICLGISQPKAAAHHGVKQPAVARLVSQLYKLDKKIEHLGKLRQYKSGS